MKKFITMLLPALLIATEASAWNDGPYYDDSQYGVVIDVQRHRGTVVYEQQCRQVRRQNSGDALAGAVIGGIIGHQFGNGGGQDAATALGVIAGAQAGSHRDTVCETVPNRRQSFTVTYRFRGRIDSFETDDPNFYEGQRVRVRGY